MGKVRDELSAQKSSKPSKAGAGSRGRGVFTQFALNLARTDFYKPMQGWYARLYTGLGLGMVAVAGAYQVYQMAQDETPWVKVGVPVVFAAVFGWLIIRIIHFPPFADFLIATEAEMNKVSWTTKADLYRATTVVLVTVLFIALYLFGVDWLWSWLLRIIGVLRFEDASSGLGSQG